MHVINNFEIISFSVNKRYMSKPRLPLPRGRSNITPPPGGGGWGRALRNPVLCKHNRSQAQISLIISLSQHCITKLQYGLLPPADRIPRIVDPGQLAGERPRW